MAENANTNGDVQDVETSEGIVTLPEGFDIEFAEFAREGLDLVITDADGDSFVVEGFFAVDANLRVFAIDGTELSLDVLSGIDGFGLPGDDVLDYGDMGLGALGEFEVASGSEEESSGEDDDPNLFEVTDIEVAAGADPEEDPEPETGGGPLPDPRTLGPDLSWEAGGTDLTGLGGAVPTGGGLQPLGAPPSSTPPTIQGGDDGDDDGGEPAPNNAPVVAASGIDGVEDGSISGRVTASDPDGDPLTYSIASGNGPSNGAVTVNADGTFTYTPVSNFSGIDSFAVTVSDGRGGASVSRVEVQVSAVADTPIVTASGGAGVETQAISLDLGAALSDTDGSETLSLVLRGLPAGAVLSAGADNGDGSWTLRAADLNGLTLSVPAGAKGEYTLVLEATASEANGDSATQSTSFLVRVDPLIHATVTGTAGNDTLYGTAGNDRIEGLEGNDRIYGRGGHDTLVAGEGNDSLYGEAGDDTLTGDAGNDRLYGGDGADTLSGGDGDDTLYVDSLDTAVDGGTGTDRLYVQGTNGVSLDLATSGIEYAYGAAGDDSFDGSGLTVNTALYGRDGADALTGGAGNDTLSGEAGNDVLVGGAGNDRLYGGDGADTLSGGDGNDTLYVDSLDTAVDGGAGTDRLYVQGTNGVSLDLATSGIEYAYGAAGDDSFDGSGLTVNTALYGRDGADALTGGAGNDTLSGEAGNDVLVGGAGNDRLYGGDGADTLSGGDGNDTLYVDSLDTAVDGGTGTDRLYVQGTNGVSLDLATSGIEYAYGAAGDDSFDGSGLTVNTALYGRDGADALTGGAGNDTLSGEAGNDVLVGGAGNDRLYGGDGADTLSGGDGNDTLYVDSLDTAVDGGAGTDRLYVQGTNGVSLDLATSGIEYAYGAAGDDSFDGSGLTVNTALYGRDGADALTGGAGNDTLSGEAGNDVLVGGAGNDRLYGGDGADTLSGGDGNDTLYVDSLDTAVDGGTGTDRLYVQGTNGVSLDLATSGIEYAYGAAGDDSFDGSGLTVNTALYGRDGADALTGGAGNDTLSGEAGNDVLVGGAGNDRLYGGDGADTLSGGDGNDTLYVDSLDTAVDGGTGTDRLYVQGTNGVSLDLATSGIEYAYGAAGDDSFDGSGLTVNTALYGRDGADALTGGAGNDTLSGEAGNDVLVGGAGNDRLYGGDGADTLSGGDGNDTLYVDSLDTAVDGGTGIDRLYVQGTNGVSLDLASSGIEYAYGAAGDDSFDGSGLTVNTALYGRDGADALTGGAGNDTLSGEAGNDVLVGGAGNDRLYGGDGSDTFVFGAGSGTDTVYDFTIGDVLRFEGTGFDADSITFAQSGSTTIVGFDGHDDVQIRLSNTSVDDLAGQTITDDSGIAFAVSVDPIS